MPMTPFVASVRRHAPAYAALLVLSAAAALSACSGETNNPTPPSGEVEIDASSTSAYTYFSLSTGKVVTVASPSTSDAWDIAFRRYEVQLNSGVAGTKGVLGYNMKNNASATSAQVLAFTADNQKPAFDAVTSANIPAPASFTGEDLAPDCCGWFIPTATGLLGNPGAAWKMRRSSGAGAGAYAVIRVESIVNAANPTPTSPMQGITIGYRLQTTPGTLGAAQTVAVDLSTLTEAGVNLTTGAIVTPTAGDCSWDVKVTQAYTFDVNSDCQAGTFPLDASQSFDGLTRADDAPTYGLFLSLISGPIPNSVSDSNAPFLYNLAGDNRLSPTFTTYQIKVGGSVYKLQVVSYYSTTGDSGHPTIRYEKIQ
jgi:hypothetical protein